MPSHPGVANLSVPLVGSTIELLLRLRMSAIATTEMSSKIYGRFSNLLETVESHSSQTLFCFISGLCCLIPAFLESNLEEKPLRHTLSSTNSFFYTSVASISAVIPLFFDALLDLLTSIRSSHKLMNTGSEVQKSHTAKTTKRFTFLNISERLMILTGVVVLPLVAFLPRNTRNLALIFLCCNKCQQVWVGATLGLSLSRYDKEYWSIRCTVLSLLSLNIGLTITPYIDNVYAANDHPSKLVKIIDLLALLLTVAPCLVFMFNSSRWLIIVYFKAYSWKRFLMCKATLPLESEIVSTAVSDSHDNDHTFFPMVYTVSGFFVIGVLLILIASSSRISDYNERDLVLNQFPFLLFIIVLSTLSMRMVKSEVVQGLVSTVKQFFFNIWTIRYDPSFFLVSWFPYTLTRKFNFLIHILFLSII